MGDDQDHGGPTERWDVVVVGSGPGGLTAGIADRARGFSALRRPRIRRSGVRGSARVRVAVIAFEQRVLFQLAFDVLAELDVRQLQQLDGLLQLGRHDQRLALFERQVLRYGHACYPTI